MNLLHGQWDRPLITISISRNVYSRNMYCPRNTSNLSFLLYPKNFNNLYGNEMNPTRFIHTPFRIFQHLFFRLYYQTNNTRETRLHSTTKQIKIMYNIVQLSFSHYCINNNNNYQGMKQQLQHIILSYDILSGINSMIQ